LTTPKKSTQVNGQRSTLTGLGECIRQLGESRRSHQFSRIPFLHVEYSPLTRRVTPGRIAGPPRLNSPSLKNDSASPSSTQTSWQSFLTRPDSLGQLLTRLDHSLAGPRQSSNYSPSLLIGLGESIPCNHSNLLLRSDLLQQFIDLALLDWFIT